MKVRARIISKALDYVDSTPFDHAEWCGAFALKVLHDCGYARDIPITISGTGSRLCEQLDITKVPLPGDIVRMKGHFAIFIGMTYSNNSSGRLSIVMRDTDLVTIDGGSFWDRVYVGRRPNHPGTLFHSIERLITNGY